MRNTKEIIKRSDRLHRWAKELESTEEELRELVVDIDVDINLVTRLMLRRRTLHMAIRQESTF